MKNICLYFQLHQPVKLRRYRFFDIGNDHYYYDDYANESNINKLAHTCYLPIARNEACATPRYCQARAWHSTMT